ncbi:MAG: hypothetical protein JNN26_18145, partial [Candidatus Obscuribacter sp.]|nr:hypothetical protein [Candidatus Obscuribacter sp.]
GDAGYYKGIIGGRTGHMAAVGLKQEIDPTRFKECAVDGVIDMTLAIGVAIPQIDRGKMAVKTAVGITYSADFTGHFHTTKESHGNGSD